MIVVKFRFPPKMPVICKLVSYVTIIFGSNVSEILPVDPKMMMNDPKMMMIDLKMMMIDLNMMTIDPNTMMIDPNMMMIDLNMMMIDPIRCFYKILFCGFLK